MSKFKIVFSETPSRYEDKMYNSFKYVNILCVMCNIVKHICQNCKIDLSKFKIVFGQPKVDTRANSFKYVNILCIMRQTSQRFISKHNFANK